MPSNRGNNKPIRTTNRTLTSPLNRLVKTAAKKVTGVVQEVANNVSEMLPNLKGVTR